MMREFLKLATVYDPQKNKTEGSYVSEKLDGMRALWLPTTRGLKFQSVPFANDGKDKRDHVCSGLWSRYGKVVFAPDWFLDQLPQHPLDGELYVGRGEHQKTISIVKEFNPDDQRWKEIGYYVFDIPSYQNFFVPGKINNPNFQLQMREGFAAQIGIYPTDKWWLPRRFENNYKLLIKDREPVGPGDLKGTWAPLVQELLPFSRYPAEELVQAKLLQVRSVGGEGLILRRPHSEWFPKRSLELLKVKKLLDAEGEVIGYNYGVGKLHCMVGSVRLKATLIDHSMALAKEIVFDLSGFTDLERRLKPEFRDEANLNPACYTENNISDLFPKGSKVTFTYRELTKDGKPKEARYLRQRVD